jgi:hypothetical protein
VIHGALLSLNKNFVDTVIESGVIHGRLLSLNKNFVDTVAEHG